MRPLDVGIIGSGTAGSAAAVFLARDGHRVTVYERVPSPAPVGAGITLQPTGLHVLFCLGLHDHVMARGARIERLFCQNVKGKPIIDLFYESVREGLFGLGLHRGVLFEALLAAVRKEPSATLRTGVEITTLTRADDRPGSRGRPPSRSTWLVDTRGERFGPHELVVVADGARSQLRDDTSTSKKIERYPWGALWFVGVDPRDPAEPESRTLYQAVDGVQRMLGLLPTGRPPVTEQSTLAPSPRLVSLFWSIREDRVAEWRSRGLDAWKAEVLGVTKAAAPILDQIHDEGQMLYAAYHDVVMHRWHTRNVVYIGDAAHATSPQLGQGCNLALWDAMELADSLREEPRDLAAALASYSRRRRDHLAFYQVATRWLTPFFQSNLDVLGLLRDAAMPLFGRASFFARIMTLSMLGVMDGFTGRTLTLRLPPPARGALG